MKQLAQLLARVQVQQATQYELTSEGKGTVVIGVGARKMQSTESGCILNCKGAGAAGNKDAEVEFKSVSEYVAEGSDDTWALWHANLPQGLADIQRIVVEDLSLDTCFALVLFVARLGEQALAPEKLAHWVRYVSAWESGRYSDTGTSPRESVACVASLLGHSYLSGIDIKPGLISCCEFLWTLFASADHPQAVAFDHGDLHYRRALGRYNYEEAQHRLAVQNSAQCQLLIPTQGGSERVLTDAIFLQESNPSAILKVLLRTDQKYSWTSRGFGFLGMYRPAEQGRGNDITLSVDPDTNLTLSALWIALEQLEDKRWGDSRPRNAPRDLDIYKNYAGLQANEPWYDGRDMTLIAAPRHVLIDGNYTNGSKLSWTGDVLPLLWKLYSPIPEAATFKPSETGASGKFFSLVKWDCGTSLEIAECPTFLAWLASLSMGKCVLSPLDLPRSETFEILRLAGGIAIVHRDGVTLFDSWDASLLDVQGLKHATWAQVDQRLADYKTFVGSKSLEMVMNQQKKMLTDKKFNTRTYREWSELVMAEKDKLLVSLPGNLNGNESYDQARLREAMERFWAVSDHRTKALEALERIERGTREAVAHLREKEGRLVNSIVAGVGLGLFAKTVVETFKDKMTMNAYEWQLEVFKKGTKLKELEAIAGQVGHWEWVSLAAFIGFFCLGAYLFWLKGTKLAASGE
ncbi:MAG: hypothetical protein H7293_05205 [Candidatus Saccharibacteria bacterium]|nr:hypothetical protein [Rhodoferax sp.]